MKKSLTNEERSALWAQSLIYKENALKERARLKRQKLSKERRAKKEAEIKANEAIWIWDDD